MSPLRFRCTACTTRHQRRGVAVLMAMICLVLVAMIGASLLKLAIAQRQQAEYEQLRLQAAWLADAALDRTAAQLRRNADYAGEAWHPQIGHQTAAATIQVEKQATRYQVTLTVDFPKDTPHRARISQHAVIEL